MALTLAELILARFRGRASHVAVCNNGKTFEPAALTKPLRASWIDSEHLGGKRCLGFYLMTEKNQVYCSCVDFDNKETSPDDEWTAKTERVYHELKNRGLTPLVEVSQSGKAAHVWIFFDYAVEAWAVRSFWKAISEYTEIPMPEVYPRQGWLKEGGLGNLVRYPFWNFSRFVDVDNDWSDIDPVAALTDVVGVTALQMEEIATALNGYGLREEVTYEPASGGLSPRVEKLLANTHSLLGRRWNGDMEGLVDRSRSALCQSIACELVRLYVSTPEVEGSIREWCNRNGYDKGERTEWVADTVRKAYSFVVSRTEQKTLDTSTIKDATIAYLEALSRGDTIVLPSGLTELDDSIGGIGFGEMAVFAARPGHGKSAFALQWVETAALSNLPCLLLSEEMGKLEIGRRAALRVTTIDERSWVRDATYVKKHIDDYWSNRAPVHLVENCHSIDRAEEMIDQYVAMHGVKVVAVDYLQLLTSRAQNRYEDITEVSRRLKQAARRNGCATIALCQLNRSIEKRPAKERTPRMSDLRESGQIEQDADLILFLEWVCKNDTSADESEYRIYCAKRRNGPIKSQVVGTEFDPNRQSFGRPQQPSRSGEWDPSGNLPIVTDDF